MDKLNPSQVQSLLRALTQSSSLMSDNKVAAGARTTNATGASAALAGTAAGARSLTLNMPPALRQIVAQAQSPVPLLQSMQTLRTGGAELPPQVRAVVEQMFSQAQAPRVTPALVSQWFGLNPVAALTQPIATQGNVNSGLWLQQALPLLLMLIRPQAGKQAPSQPLQQAIAQLLGQPTLTPALLQMLRDLQGNLQQARLSQLHYADTATRQEPDYYLTLPWLIDKEPSLIELLLQRRKQSGSEQEQEELWVLSMRLQIKAIGPVLARVRWNGAEAAIHIYTDNDSASRWLEPKVAHLETQLTENGIAVKQLEVQTGRIPASLAPDPNQLIKVRV